MALIALTLSACTTLQVGSDFDRSANFSGYHTFAWMLRERYGSSNPLVVQRAQDAIQAELVHKGFSYVGDSAAADEPEWRMAAGALAVSASAPPTAGGLLREQPPELNFGLV